MRSEEADLDFGRRSRTSLPEVVYAEYKTLDQIVDILDVMIARDGWALATRVQPEKGAALDARFPQGRYDARARSFGVGTLPPSGAQAGVVCAGTSDLPVADEAAFALEAFGHTVVRRNDAGVAGLHRIQSHAEALDRCRIVIVVAGMEGALPSVVAGLIRPPVIAVPTSVGYGAALGGLTALLAMLTSCAPGIAVVNVDNGFGAAAFAHKFLARVVE